MSPGWVAAHAGREGPGSAAGAPGSA